MVNITKYLGRDETGNFNIRPGDWLTLPFALRQKSRLRATLDHGEEAGLFLARGTVLRDGDLLEAENGLVVMVRAADEDLSTAVTTDATLLAKACYHLGNRHVAVQILKNRVSYLSDHVLDNMVRGLGLEVTHESGPFEPESGAYHAHFSEQGDGD